MKEDTQRQIKILDIKASSAEEATKLINEEIKRIESIEGSNIINITTNSIGSYSFIVVIEYTIKALRLFESNKTQKEL